MKKFTLLAKINLAVIMVFLLSFYVFRNQDSYIYRLIPEIDFISSWALIISLILIPVLITFGLGSLTIGLVNRQFLTLVLAFISILISIYPIYYVIKFIFISFLLINSGAQL